MKRVSYVAHFGNYFAFYVKHQSDTFRPKSFVFWLLDMSIPTGHTTLLQRCNNVNDVVITSCAQWVICHHVHRLELRNLFKVCVARLAVKLEIRTRFNFGHACPK